MQSFEAEHFYQICTTTRMLSHIIIQYVIRLRQIQEGFSQFFQAVTLA